MSHPLLKKYASVLAAAVILMAVAAMPYLLPEDPDSAVFRSGSLGALLLLGCYLPARTALERRSLRVLVFSGVFALIFSLCLSLGSELVHYGEFLHARSSMIRRLAVPMMITPLFTLLLSNLFAYMPGRLTHKSRIPYPVFFLIFAVCYLAVLLAYYPGIINYDFPSEYQQFLTGRYDAKHPVFHTVLIGALYRLGEMVFGSLTAGALLYSIVQILLLSAMYAYAMHFIQRRIPFLFTLILTALTALLPIHGVIAISTVKDALFTGLIVLLCVQLWRIVEDPKAFISSRGSQLCFMAICLLLALIRLNGVFAFLPAIAAVLFLCRRHMKRAAAYAALTALICLLVPRGLELAVGAQKSPSSELMSIPCQQLMRAAEFGDVNEEEYAEINSWFANITYRYRPHYADTAKGNLDLKRYNNNPGEFWEMYLKYAARNPRVYTEAFLLNCLGYWYPDDISHAHSLDSEEWDFVYLKVGNTLNWALHSIEAQSFLPGLQTLLYNFMHHATHERYPILSLLMRPSFYNHLLLLAILYLFCRRGGRYALALLPLCGVAVSLFFSAGAFVRYAYPVMTAMPIMLALALYSSGTQPDTKEQGLG
ncbi:MAG: hypothetical protein J6K32_01970 [Clostridia bacterium]|nr:hypothetical protein [Clostridia bacterium]